MHRIDTPTKATDLFGLGKHGCRDGDKAAGIQATVFDAAFFNDLTENIARFIESRGLALLKGDFNQLTEAIELAIEELGFSESQSHTWAKAQSGVWAPMPATAGTVLMDFTAANLFTGQATGNITFGNGYTGPGAGKGGAFVIRVQQGAAALYNWAFASNWKHIGGAGAIPGQTQTLGAWDTLVGQVLTDGTVEFAVRSDVK